MIHAQCATYQTAIAPAAIIDDASATAAEIDTIGANYAEVVITLGATDIAMTALKLQHGDTSGGSFVDIIGATFDGGINTEGTALALPSATDDGQVCVFQVNLDTTKRFLKVVATFGNGTAGGFVSGIARLSAVDLVPTADTSIATGGVCRV